MEIPSSPSPLSRFGFFYLIGGVVLVGVCWGVLQYLSDHPHKSGDTRGKTSEKNVSSSPSTGDKADASKGAGGVDPAAVAKLRETMAQALAVLRDPNNTNKQGALDALRAALKDAEPKVAIVAIRQFLDSGEDAATGMRFKLGLNHELEDAPTMRTFLMDELGKFSRDISAGDAAEVARATLATKSSADEWALAMRNIAWADPEGSKAMLAAKFNEMINYAPWQQSPTGGFYEMFDAAAYSGDPSTIELLAPLANGSIPALKRAAQVALQRLSAMAPEAVPAYLNSHPNMLSDIPEHRADYMGNVDLNTANGLSQAETYLNRTDVTDAEKTKFLARLGMPAAFEWSTLLTPEHIVNMSILDHRALVNTVASNWMAANKFPTLQPQLQNLVDFTKP